MEELYSGEQAEKTFGALIKFLGFLPTLLVTHNGIVGGHGAPPSEPVGSLRSVVGNQELQKRIFLGEGVLGDHLFPQQSLFYGVNFLSS